MTDIDNKEEDNTVLSRDEENNTEEEKEEEAEQEEETGDKVMPILEPHRYDADESYSDEESVPDGTSDNPKLNYWPLHGTSKRCNPWHR